MYFNTWQFHCLYSIPYRNAVMSICTGIEDDKIIFPAGLMDFIYDFTFVVGLDKSASYAKPLSISMTAAAISARVTVPYTSGSVNQSNSDGTIYHNDFFCISIYFPLSLRYPIHRDRYRLRDAGFFFFTSTAASLWRTPHPPRTAVRGVFILGEFTFSVTTYLGGRSLSAMAAMSEDISHRCTY